MIYRDQKLNKRLIIISSILIPFVTLFSTLINWQLGEGQRYVQELREKIDNCEKLNWDSSYVHYNLESLDWYVASMVADNLMTENEANNTINKFILENLKKVLEIEGKSEIDEFEIFKDKPELINKFYIIDLYDEDHFSYTYTYNLLLERYGENNEPFLLMFNIRLMTDVVDEVEFYNVKLLEISATMLILTISLLASIIILLSTEEEPSKNKEQRKENNFRRILSLILFVMSLCFILISLYLSNLLIVLIIFIIALIILMGIPKAAQMRKNKNKHTKS